MGGFRLRRVSLTPGRFPFSPPPPGLSLCETPGGSTWGSPLRRMARLTDEVRHAMKNDLNHRHSVPFSARCCAKNTQSVPSRCATLLCRTKSVSNCSIIAVLYLGFRDADQSPARPLTAAYRRRFGRHFRAQNPEKLQHCQFAYHDFDVPAANMLTAQIAAIAAACGPAGAMVAAWINLLEISHSRGSRMTCESNGRG